MQVEPPKNGQVDQRIQRRPDSADAETRTTDGFFPSHALGLAGAETAPKNRRSSWRPTLNGDHRNSSVNSSTATPGKSRPATAWHLPDLIRALPVRKQPCQRQPKLLPHYPAVTEYVYNSRFAIASQIQRRFAGYMPSVRTAQYQLANLVQLGYLRTASVRSTGPNFPYVYHATSRGVELVEDGYRTIGRTWHGTTSEGTRAHGIALPSILHELLLTEFDLAVGEGIERRPDLKRLFVERRYFQSDKRLRFQHHGRRHSIIPDSGFLLRLSAAGGSHRSRLLLHVTELDNGTMSLSRLLEKLQHYQRWSGSTEGTQYLETLRHRYQGDSVSDYRLLLIVRGTSKTGDRGRLIDSFIQVLELSSTMRNRIWLTTVESLRHHDRSANALDAAIWVRPRQARAWMPAYRQLQTDLSDADARTRLNAQRRFVGERLGSILRQPLFSSQQTD
jgi:hypothetical protein